MCPFNTSDCLIEVIAWEGLTIHFFCITCAYQCEGWLPGIPGVCGK